MKLEKKISNLKSQMDKLFKKIFMLVVALVATTAFAACGDDDGDDNGGGTVITGLTVTPTSLNFTKLGGSQVVSAQAQQQATAQSSADWCTVGQHHHEGAGDSKGYGAGLELG